MLDLIEDRRDVLARICEQYRVRCLELFGSALTERQFDPDNSDLDFLVEFLPLEEGEHANAYFGLLEAIEDLFGRRIDLVMIRAVRNPYFAQAIDRSREVIYAA